MTTRTVAVIVDESANRRAEIKNLLANEPVNVAAEAGYGVEAVTMVEERKPGLVFAAVEEPIGRAVQTIESIHTAAPDVKVIAYSSHSSVDVVRQAMRAGAVDFLQHPLRKETLKKAITEAVGETEGAREDSAGPGTVITVVGAKGGIGKSTIAVNLATAIAKQSQDSVLLIDLDTRFGDVAIMMDLEPRYVVADIAASIGTLNRDTFRNALVEHESGVSVLPSVKSPSEWRSMTADQVRALIRFAQRLFDYVVVDTPGIYGDNVAAAIELASQVVLVTTVDITSVKDTTFVLEILEKTGFPKDRVMVTVNHANGTNSVTGADVARVLHTEVAWELPHDPAVSVGLQAGKPVVLDRPRSPASRKFNEIAAKITGTPVPSIGRGFALKRMLPLRNRGEEN